MTKFSVQLFRNNMYMNVVLLCSDVLGYDTLSYGRRVQAVGWGVCLGIKSISVAVEWP